LTTVHAPITSSEWVEHRSLEFQRGVNPSYITSVARMWWLALGCRFRWDPLVPDESDNFRHDLDAVDRVG
jgi:hypothetical protein